MAPRVTAIVAMDRNGLIGKGNELPWKLSSDLQRFKRTTIGHTLVMGRKTFDSIGRPLPGRKTIVLSRNTQSRNSQRLIEGVSIAANWDEVLASCVNESHLFIVGGAEIYKLLLPHCDDVLLTRVLTRSTGDVYFPEWDWWNWSCVFREHIPQGPRDQWPTEVEWRVSRESLK